MLHIPLIETILRFGPDLDAKDVNGRDCRWYVENHYRYEEEQLDAEEIAQRQQRASALLDGAENRSDNELEFIEVYEEKYDEFVLKNEWIPLYRSTKNDFNVLFEAILKQDFERIINLIDRHHVDLNAPAIDGTTALHFACEHSGALIVKFLMDRGALPFKI